MTNRVPPFDPVKNPIEVQTIQKKLASASHTPFVLGVSEPALLFNNGTKETSIVVPF
jgi:hypothetical protein